MRAFSDRFIALVCALAVLAVLITAARADAYEDGLRRFTADSFDETIEGINAVATSGNARAAQVIGALQEGRLLFSAAEKRVFIREIPDQLIGPLPAICPPTSRRCGSTIVCGGSSRPRSAA